MLVLKYIIDSAQNMQPAARVYSPACPGPGALAFKPLFFASDSVND